MARPGPGPEIPLTGLAFHLRDSDPGNSRGSDGFVGLGPT